MSVILQNGVGWIPGRHYLTASPRTASWGWLPQPGDVSVLTVDSGDSVTVDTLSHEGLMPGQGSDPVAYFAQYGVPADAVLADARRFAADYPAPRAGVDGPHIVLGPIAVRGARPGDVLCVEFLEMAPRVPYGMITSRHGKGALPFEVPSVHGPQDPAVFSAFCRLEDTTLHLAAAEAKLRFPFAPMAGIVGVTPTGPSRHSIPPGPFGGNLDVKDLQVGSRIYLAVQIDEAGCYIGDPHFAQGHGEVALTAVEAALRITVRLDLIPRRDATPLLRQMHNPIIETATHWIALGLGADLDEAMRAAVRGALDLVTSVANVDRSLAMVYISAASDFVVTQVVNEVKGIHCLIRKADLDLGRDLVGFDRATATGDA